MTKNAMKETKIIIDNKMLDYFKSKDISEIYLEQFTLTCGSLEKIFNPYNQENEILRYDFEEGLFDERNKRYKKSVNRNQIIENAAGGHFLSYIVTTRQDIEEFEVLNPPEDGYDFTFRINGQWIALEVSGVKTNNRKAFSSRVSEKRTKFAEYFYQPAATEHLIGIVDFIYERFTLWDNLITNNYKQ